MILKFLAHFGDSSVQRQHMKLRQGDCQSQVSLIYIARPCVKKAKG